MPKRETRKFKLDIRTLLLLLFVSIMGVSLLLMLALGLLHLRITSQYAAVTDRLILENRFSTLVPSFLDAYLDLASGGWEVTESRRTYFQIRDEIDASIRELDVTVTSDESASAYRSLRTFVRGILDSAEQGIELLEAGRVSEAWNLYRNELGVMRPFVYENIGRLSVPELGIAQRLQSDVQRTERALTAGSVTAFLLLLVADVLLVLYVSKRITEPLSQITELGNAISEGDIGLKVDPMLLARQDELGTLAGSLDDMLHRLDAEIVAQKKANDLLVKAGKELTEKNAQLEKFNRLMVDRELKMIELKKRIAELEATVKTKG